MMTSVPILIALIIGISMTPPVSADSHARYVIDQVILTVRDKPLGEGKVIHRLTTGDAMFLTGLSNESYVEVAIPNGPKGWVDADFITATPISKVELERQLERSLAIQSESEDALVQLSEDYRRLSEEFDELRNNQGKPSGFEAQIEQLKFDITASRAEAEKLDRKNKELLENSQWEWFLAGAGTLILGILIGLVIARRSRRSIWGDR